MKKVLDFLLIFLLTFMIVNYFNQPEQKSSGGVSIKMTDGSYTIPATVKLAIDNGTSEDITLNSCDDVNITRNGENLVFGDSFCSDLIVGA